MKKEKSCKNCYWNKNCSGIHRCEDYYSVYEENIVKEAEYKKDLTERVEEYEDLIAEQQG